MTNLDGLQDRYREFVATRDWNQFHTPKNLAEAIRIKANELLEYLQYAKSGEGYQQETVSGHERFFTLDSVAFDQQQRDDLTVFDTNL